MPEEVGGSLAAGQPRRATCVPRLRFASSTHTGRTVDFRVPRFPPSPSARFSRGSSPPSIDASLSLHLARRFSREKTAAARAGASPRPESRGTARARLCRVSTSLTADGRPAWEREREFVYVRRTTRFEQVRGIESRPRRSGRYAARVRPATLIFARRIFETRGSGLEARSLVAVVR